MKLNKKGFAFSTMLYGTVALIAAVLYLILNVNKDTTDTTYYFGEEVLASLNECVTEEIALENCYAAGNSCNATAYHACLGISDSNATQKGIIIAEKLKETLVADPTQDGLHADPYESNRYIYMGSNVDNYIQFSGKIWRIVSIELGGYLKLIDTTKFANVSWDNTGKGTWAVNCTLYDTLTSNYLTTISDTSKLFQGDWYASILYPSMDDNYGLTSLVTQEKSGGNDSKKASRVGILSLSDYLKAHITNDECHNLIFGDDTKNCSSWLSEYKGWVIDINGELGNDNEGYAYYFGDFLGDTENATPKYNSIFYDKTDEKHDVYPIIYLDRNSVFNGGNGTQANPYVLK